MTGREDTSEKETVRVPSMEQTCMDCADNKYIMCDPVKKERICSARGSCRIAAAGLAGALLAANAGGQASASMISSAAGRDAAASAVSSALDPEASASMISSVFDPDAAALRSSAPDIRISSWGDHDTDEETEPQDSGDHYVYRPVSYWDEEEVLERWGLDPDDFPDVPEKRHPEIPDALLPYFQESTSDAVSWYAGETPPAADLSKYSARANAIRKAAAEKAEKALDQGREQVLDTFHTLAQTAGTSTGRNLVSSLQGGAYSGGSAHVLTDLSKDSVPTVFTPDVPVRDGRKTDPGRPFVTIPGSYFADDDHSSPGKEDFADDHSSGEKDTVIRRKTVHPKTFKYLLPAPFVYDTDPDIFVTDFPGRLPVPVGIDPQPWFFDSYIQGSAIEEKSEAAEENAQTPQEADPASMSDPEDAAAFGNDSVESDFVESETEADAGNPDADAPEEEKAGGREAGKESKSSFVPFRFYTDDRSADTDGGSAHSGLRRTIFIGDSRTVGIEMQFGGASEEYWSAEVSMGYSWMANTGIPKVEHLIDQNTDVVILMGVNDLGNVSSYANHINMKAAEWKELGARTFFVSVGPVDDRRSPNAKNARIESFNTYMQDNLQDVYYIDIYNRIRNSFGSPDGIHFDGATNREIYNTIKFCLYRGWYEEAGLWFYFDCGKPVTGWQYLDGQWQYMDGYGVRWVKDGRVGDMGYIPLPDFYLKGTDFPGLSF